MSDRIHSLSGYFHEYQKSVADPENFWARIADSFHWKKRWDKVLDWNFDGPDVKWFVNGKLNITENILERHLFIMGDKPAIIWEPNEPGDPNRILTYKELYEEVCRFSNVLVEKGVGKGDKVIIYMPMVPEAAIAMLACARIGAVHSVVFAGFSSSALADRIEDCKAKVVLTSDGNYRGKKKIAVKSVVDEALETTDLVETMIVYQRTGQEVNMKAGRDFWWHEAIEGQSTSHVAEEMDSEDELFILYTSGSTGKPKGVVHTCGGYMIYSKFTFENVFQYTPGDVYWCTADVGWITGHSYIVYGPLLTGATTIMFEGVPTYPNPINEEAWHWYHTHIGKTKCPIVDTWWQTETGGIMVSPLAGITPTKPAFATLPLPGVQLAIMDPDGKELKGNSVEGNLCIKFPWPGMIRTTYGDHERCKQTYFSAYKGMYFTGDGVKRDHDGYYRILGRVDDVINVSGHRMGTAEVENAINEHPLVVESAVVGYPHKVKGQGIYAYVICDMSNRTEANLTNEIKASVTNIIGPIAKPDKIQIVPGLPKTRSGKIMRRILRKVAEGSMDNLGDTSTLLDPDIVDKIIAGRKE